MNKALVLAALLNPLVALATTDCTSTVGAITVETGSTSVVTVILSANVGFSLRPDSPNSRDIIAMVQYAQVSGSPITVRFASEKMNCMVREIRSDLVAIVRDQRSSDFGTTTTPPSAMSGASSPNGPVSYVVRPLPRAVPSSAEPSGSGQVEAQSVGTGYATRTEVPAPEPESTSRSIPEVRPQPCDVNAYRSAALNKSSLRSEQVVMKTEITKGTAKLEMLLAERKTIDGELDFYERQPLPRKLRRMLEDSNYEIASTKRWIDRSRCSLAQYEAG